LQSARSAFTCPIHIRVTGGWYRAGTVLQGYGAPLQQERDKVDVLPSLEEGGPAWPANPGIRWGRLTPP